MTNHPNRSEYRYLKWSPREFANEVMYFRVAPPDWDAADAWATMVCNAEPGGRRTGYACWTRDRAAKIPGSAVDWADRKYAGVTD